MSTDLVEQNQELQAEVNVLLERVTALQQEVTRLERANKVMEQRLRRIGDAVVEGRVVDGS